MKTFNKCRTISKKLDAATGGNIVPIFTNTTVGITSSTQILSANAFVKNLKAYAKIDSLPPIKLPNFKLEDSETDKLYKTLDIEWNSARKQLNLYISDNPNDWFLIGAISLLNPSGYPYRMYNLMDLYTDNLAIELGENGRIGVQITDVGYGLLQGSDTLTIHGSYLQEIAIEDDLLQPKMITNTNNFTKLISNTSGVILQSMPTRKYVVLVNNSTTGIFINLGDMATINKGIYLAPNGTYEFNTIDVPYYGQISAIGLGDATLVGVECT